MTKKQYVKAYNYVVDQLVGIQAVCAIKEIQTSAQEAYRRSLANTRCFSEPDSLRKRLKDFGRYLEKEEIVMFLAWTAVNAPQALKEGLQKLPEDVQIQMHDDLEKTVTLMRCMAPFASLY